MTNETFNPSSIRTLLDMLAYRRPAGSKTERRFIREYLEPLGVQRDAFGNLTKRIGNAPILWSSHTDTVHKQGGIQAVKVTQGWVKLAKSSPSNCLGADCTAGVWLMREMIQAGIPGLYVFHREEECGGLGSGFIADTTPQLLDGIQAAIAFDRRGATSIITHQWGGRCASDAFANSLGEALGIAYQLDDGGTFTDTANYTHIVPECCNVSVGFYDEHTARESLNLRHVIALRDALLKLDTGKLVIERNPSVVDRWEHVKPGIGAGDWSSYSFNDNDNGTPLSLVEMVKRYPLEVADLLEAFGMDSKGLEDEIIMRGGFFQ